MKVGDTIEVPANEGVHAGHTLTVTKVEHHEPAYYEPPENRYDAVSVLCSCGDSWRFVDEDWWTPLSGGV